MSTKEKLIRHTHGFIYTHFLFNLSIKSFSKENIFQGIFLKTSHKQGIPEFLDSGRKSWTLDSGA